MRGRTPSKPLTSCDGVGCDTVLAMTHPTTQDWQVDVQRKAAEVEALQVRLRLAVLVLRDALNDRPKEETKNG